MPRRVTDNPKLNRYELPVDGDTAFASYHRQGDVLVVFHSEVPRHVAGRGLGTALVKGMLDDVRLRGLKVEPRCSFVAGFFREHAEYRDLLQN